MADHSWVLEHIPTYLAGGLELADRPGFEEHVAECGECGRALEEQRRLDEALGSLFTSARPRPGLEDRTIQRLRAAGRRGPLSQKFFRFAVAAAAVVMLGLTGAAMSYFVDEGNLPFPGAAARRARSHEMLTRTVESANDLRELNLENADIGGDAGEGRSRLRSAQEVAQDLADHSALRGARALDGRHDGGWVNNTAYALDRLDDTVTAASKLPAPPRKDGYGYGGWNSKSKPDPYGNADDKESSRVGRVKTDAPGRTPDLPNAEGGEDKVKNREYYPTPGPTTTAAPVDPSADGKGSFRYNSVGGMGTTGSFRPGEALAKPDSPKPSGGDPGKGQPGGGGQDQKKPTNDSSGATRTGPGQVDEQQADPAPAIQRKIIRSGTMDFEVENFDAAKDRVERIAAEEKGIITTVNSDKLPNGKMQGTLVVKVEPDRLNSLMSKLRALGDLKGQRISSQDVTKQYTDLGSRLKAAQAMEQRLLQIIKEGKGEIKDLLAAEQELGKWRTRIEEFLGEIKYYDSQVSLSTLTITLTEREIRTAFAVSETQRIDMGIEVEDVESAQQKAHAAVAEAKGRITRSELKQHGPGQYQAILQFEVAPDQAGPLRDQLKTYGDVVRLDVGRLQQAEGGVLRPQEPAKVKRDDVQFIVSLHNVATVDPRETVQVNLASDDVEGAYRKLLARVQKTAVRVLTNRLDAQRADQASGTLTFEVKSAEADAVLEEIKKAGEVMRLQVTESQDPRNSTKTKRGFQVVFQSLAQVPPKETDRVQLVAKDVAAAYKLLQQAVAGAKGRVLHSQLNEQDRQNVTAQLDFEVRRTEEAAITAALSAQGAIYARNVSRAQDNQNAVDSKVLYVLKLSPQSSIEPRERLTLVVEVKDAEQAAANLAAKVITAKGRTVEGPVLNQERTGQVNARVVFDVPLVAATALAEEFKAAGTVRGQRSQTNHQVPDNDLAVARIEVALFTTSPLVASDQGLWASVRSGLSKSFSVLAWSLVWIIFGITVLWPVGIGFGVWWLVHRSRKKAETAIPPPAAS